MANTYSAINFHIVFSTKKRQPLIIPALEPRLNAYLTTYLQSERCYVKAIGGMADHIHLLINVPPSKAPSDIVRKIKGASSHWVNQLPDGIANTFGWQDGYAIYSVSASALASVSSYIFNQKQHHAQRDFQSEYKELLKLHGISFEDAYVFD